MLASLDHSLFSCFKRAGDLGRRLMELGETTQLSRLMERNKSQQPENIAAQRDQLVLSEALQRLRATGLDLNRSGVVQNDLRFSFNLQFEDEHVRALTSNGVFDARSQSMKMDLSFRSSMTFVDPENGTERQELFEINFRMELSNTGNLAEDVRMEKEDILHFARKILNKLAKLSSEGEPIDGLELKKEDLLDLGGVDDGRLLHGILDLISQIRACDQLQNRGGPYAAVPADRDRSLTPCKAGQEGFEAEYSLSVAQVSQELVYQAINGAREAV